ncbi:unnamed protein product [Anisakis simplex]|uniref:Histone-lysine N-methyltransferase met-2 (inferred by orthology to a C. elegans protein) n=1 Tax=Anisakis simplex TaxID=6269 RepID=A0A0M3K1W0_ANISI|nr:unnamed protein product [Anisakis simplex]
MTAVKLANFGGAAERKRPYPENSPRTPLEKRKSDGGTNGDNHGSGLCLTVNKEIPVIELSDDEDDTHNQQNNAERQTVKQEKIPMETLPNGKPAEPSGPSEIKKINDPDGKSGIINGNEAADAENDQKSTCSSEDIVILSDTMDLSAMDCGSKIKYERRIKHVYAVCRQSRNGEQICDLESIDDSDAVRMVFDEERISQALVAYHVEKKTVPQAAASLKISNFELIVYLLDHIWHERDRTVEGYSLVGVASFIRIERAAIQFINSLLVRPEEMTPAQFIAVGSYYFYRMCYHLDYISIRLQRTLLEPVELIFIMTVLLARMYRKIEPISHTTTDVTNICGEIDKSTKAMHMECLPSSKVIPKPSILPAMWSKRATRLEQKALNASADKPSSNVSSIEPKSSIINNNVNNVYNHTISSHNVDENNSNNNKNNSTESDLSKNYNERCQQPLSEIPRLVSGGEDISVVETRLSEFSRPGFVLMEDPVNLDDIPEGAVCLGRQKCGLNFIRCTIIRRLTAREYYARFTDGVEESVDISRIAKHVPGWLRIWEGVRVCALYEPKLTRDPVLKAFYSGIVAVGLHGFTNNEMLVHIFVFFDNGLDAMVNARSVCILAEQQYVTRDDGKKVIDRRKNYVLMPKKRQMFVKHYLKKYPDWPLVPMKRRENTQRVNVTLNDVPYSAFVLQTERQFALLRFPPKKRVPGADCVLVGCKKHEHIDEWVYRGSDRLDTIRQTIEQIREREERQQQKSVSLNMVQSRREARLMNNFEYAIPLDKGSSLNLSETRSDPDLSARGRALFNLTEETENGSGQTMKNLLWHPINEWKYLRKRVHDTCSVDCLQEQETDPTNLTFKACSPYMIPLMSGWKRQCVHKSASKKLSKGDRLTIVRYETPCGIAMYEMAQIAEYLKVTCSHLTVDLFTFNSHIRPNVVYKSPIESRLVNDYSRGYEAVPIVVTNEVDHETPPKMQYDPRRYPFNEDTDVSTISKEFCSGCSCTDDCANEANCECRQITRTEISRLAKTLQPLTVRGYDYRSLNPCNEDETILSGIYECNDACKCEKNKCMNRVVQLGIRIPLELFKTQKMGWGVRTLVDIPPGKFICTYAGAILTDSQAEECGKAYGDEYFADVDFVDVVENAKQAAGVDISEDYYFSDENEETEKEERKIDFVSESVSDEDSQASAGNGIEREIDDDNDYYSDSYESESGADLGSMISTRSSKNRPKDLANQNSDRLLNSNETASTSNNSDDTLQADLAFASTSFLVSSRDERNGRGNAIGLDAKLQCNSVVSSMLNGERSAESGGYADEDVSDEDCIECDSDGNRVASGRVQVRIDPAAISDDDDDDDKPSARFSMVSYVEGHKRPSLYTIDAKRKGNIGKFFNHSCEPNMKTYLVFVDTHDFRLPWIAFFTTKYVAAGTELCWDYGYTEGAVAGKKMRCLCGSKNCRKRLL